MKMSKLTMSLLMVATAWNGKAMAANTQPSNLDLNEREQVKAATRVLINAGAMSVSADGTSLKVSDADLINELRADGTITRGMSVESVVCIEGGAR